MGQQAEEKKGNELALEPALSTPSASCPSHASFSVSSSSFPLPHIERIGVRIPLKSILEFVPQTSISRVFSLVWFCLKYCQGVPPLTVDTTLGLHFSLCKCCELSMLLTGWVSVLNRDRQMPLWDSLLLIVVQGLCWKGAVNQVRKSA